METPQRDPAPGPDLSRPAYLVALFVAITWAAFVFAVDGLLAFFLDRDPVPPGISIYYGLAAPALAGLVVWIAAARVPRAPGPFLSAVVAAAGVYLVIVGAAAFSGLRLVAVEATSPFTLVAVLAAAAAVIATRYGLRAWRARPPSPGA